jgi:hypothetical protein
MRLLCPIPLDCLLNEQLKLFPALPKYTVLAGAHSEKELVAPHIKSSQPQNVKARSAKTLPLNLAVGSPFD